MRKILLMFILVVMAACNRDEIDDNFVSNLNHQVSVTYNDAYGNQAVKGAKVVFTSKETSVTYTGTTNAEGKATITLPAGSYSVQATKDLTATEAQTLTGTSEAKTFNASIDNVIINSETASTPSSLVLVSGRVGDLVIKQVYYAGSSITEGAMYRDQFFEIYNNSDEVIYLDNICFAQIMGVASYSVANITKQGYLPSGQYDWSLSEGLTDQGSKANTDYAYADEVIAFPGSGQDHPLQPGKSVIVAATALNHKAPLTVGSTTYTVVNPDLTVDLNKAPFEAYFADYLGTKALDSDVDNPNSTNMNILYKVSGGRDLILDPLGRDAFAIFRATQAEINAWRTAPLPTVATVTSTTTRYLQVPVSVIIDGVNLRNPNNTQIPNRLVDVVDAGQIQGNKGSYSSESGIRKVKTTLSSGRVIYQDTNNSTNDFEMIDRPDVSALN